jgi:nitronate monooxygenase
MTSLELIHMNSIVALKGRLSLPVIGSPLFMISAPDLVIAQCRAGVIGSMPSLNARPAAQLDDWLAEISERLGNHDKQHPNSPSAPFAINLIVHRSNNRLQHDLAICIKHRVPIIIVSLGVRAEVNDAIHSYGGLVFHDVTSQKFAHKAIESGADGLILIAAGAGGHASTLSPFALVQETRSWYDGPLALSGAISTGRAILASEVMGADFAYIGSAFIATDESMAALKYKKMIVESEAADIIYTNAFTGIHGNFLKASIVNAGYSLAELTSGNSSKMEFSTSVGEVWKDIWGAGQGIGIIKSVEPTERLIARLRQEYEDAKKSIARLI